MKNDSLKPVLERIANALERLAPETSIVEQKMDSTAYVWDKELNHLKTIKNVSRLDLTLLKGLDQQTQILYDNTKQFAQGLPANNALLWGARGTGKSSLIKAIHGNINENTKFSIILVEIFREDINSLPALLDRLKNNKKRFILFCDDLSFEDKDTEFKSLKAVLEGGIEGRPENVIFYATSNRRHLMPRDMIENERSSAIHTSESVEEKVSLSDRFGLWLGFHPINQETYFEIVDSYAKKYNLEIDNTDLKSQALEWSMTRGSRSGRVAWQFIQDLAGKQGKKIN
jgi:predicted AAA+ superfamily ATPase|tara:strand:+ start:1878 stop:2735 length:858 start_codon:yes stop_codon:yes gene_type:complete